MAEWDSRSAFSSPIRSFWFRRPSKLPSWAAPWCLALAAPWPVAALCSAPRIDAVRTTCCPWRALDERIPSQRRCNMGKVHYDIVLYIYICKRWNKNSVENWTNTPVLYIRRKFLKSNFRQYGQMKSRAGQRQREEKDEKREDQRRERVRRKKMQMREKVGKSRNTVFFQWFEAPEGRKVGSLKRQVRSQLARWEMNKCTPLWREAHFQFKIYKTPQPRTTFGSWDVGKVHAVVARSTFPSQNVQNTFPSDHFWKLRCRKSARRCGAKHISKWKCTKHHLFAPPLEVQMSFRVAGAKDCAPCQKWAKRKGFVAFPKTMAGVGHLKRICKDAFSVAGAVQETCSSEMLGGPGADFLRGVAFWSMGSSVLGRWFCVTGAALRMTWHHFFVAGAVL